MDFQGPVPERHEGSRDEPGKSSGARHLSSKGLLEGRRIKHNYMQTLNGSFKVNYENMKDNKL